MQIYLGTSSYDIFPSFRTAGGWNVSINEDRFDLRRFSKVAAERGCCVLVDVTEDEARQWAAANPIANPHGWARVAEILDRYGFGLRFRLRLTD